MLENSRINYQKIDKTLSPYYKFSKLSPTEGTGDLVLSAAGGEARHFEIPSTVYNLSKSVLSYRIACPSSGGALVNYRFMDCLSEIRELELYTREGQYLTRVNEVGRYTKIVWKPETQLEKFLTFPLHSHNEGWGKYLQKCNVSNQLSVDVTKRDVAVTASTLVGDTAVDKQAEIKAQIDASVNAVRTKLIAWLLNPGVAAQRCLSNTVVLTGVNTGDASDNKSGYVNLPYTEPRYFDVGTAANASPDIDVKIDLGMIYNTILAMDKDLYLGRPIVLRLVFNSASQIYFTSTHATATGPGADALVAGAGAVTISDMNLFLAIEKNETIVRGLVGQVQKGMKILMPYVHYSKRLIPQSTTQNISLRFDSTHGQKLQKIYHSLFHATESVNTCYDNSNMGGTNTVKLITYHTEIQGERLQEFEVNIANQEDYMMIKDKLQGSVIQNADIFYYNHFVLDDFTECRSVSEQTGMEFNCLQGLDISDREIKWDIACTTSSNAFNHYSFAICQRTLDISPSGVLVI